MSGFFLRLGARWGRSRVPKPVRDAINEVDAEWDRMDAKESSTQQAKQAVSDGAKKQAERMRKEITTRGNPRR